MDSLKDQRAKIDAIDSQIVKLLVERFRVVDEVARIKAQQNISVVQSERAEAVKTRVANLAEQDGLDGQLLRHIYTLIIDHAHVVENDIIAGEKAGL